MNPKKSEKNVEFKTDLFSSNYLINDPTENSIPLLFDTTLR
jgi:hypothetical protein